MSVTLDCKDIGVRKTEFVARTQFLYLAVLLNSFAVCCMYSYLGVVTNPSTTNLIRSTAVFFVVFCRAPPIDVFFPCPTYNQLLLSIMEGFSLLDSRDLISTAIFSREKNTTEFSEFTNLFSGFSCFKVCECFKNLVQA